MKGARYAVIVVVILVISLEAWLWAAGIPADVVPPERGIQFSAHEDPEVGYTNLRSADIPFIYSSDPRGYFGPGNTVHHTTNSAGYRGGEIPLKKIAGIPRVLFLGDSFTFGEGVHDADVYSEQFEALAARAGKKVESVNLGIGGANTAQEYTLLEYAADLNPDHIVVGYGLNDARDPLYYIVWENSVPRFLERPDPLTIYLRSLHPLASPFNWSRVLRILHGWDVNRRATTRILAYYHDLYRPNAKGWQETKDAIRRFGEYQKTTGQPVTFIIFPLLFELDAYEYEEEHRLIHEELERNGLASIDLLPLLAGKKDADLWVHPTDQHPNEIVHRIAAEALVEYFLRNPAP
jgi:hypothetical protein